MTLRSLPNIIVYSRYLASPTVVPRRWPHKTLMNACPVTMTCLRVASSSPRDVGRPDNSPALSILSADTLSLAYRYDVQFDTVKYWIPKRWSPSGRIQHRWNWCPKLFHMQCGLDIVAVHPENEQHKEISVIMRTIRVPNSAATTSCDIIVIILSASPFGTHHSDNFLGWLLFKSCRCLV